MNATRALLQFIRKYGIICGIAGPVIYTFMVIFLGLLQPGFNHITQLMSELGETGAPHAILMNLAGFTLTGILLILFAARFYLEFAGIRGATPASLLLALTGMLYLGEAYFSCDAGCIPVTVAGSLHLLLGQAAVFVAVVAAFVIAYVLKSAGDWQGYWQYSIMTGILVILVIPLIVSRPDIAGLLQRVLVGIILVWWEVLAIRMYLINKDRGSL
jgi:hypothetical membrane protein